MTIAEYKFTIHLVLISKICVLHWKDNPNNVITLENLYADRKCSDFESKLVLGVNASRIDGRTAPSSLASNPECNTPAMHVFFEWQAAWNCRMGYWTSSGALVAWFTPGGIVSTHQAQRRHRQDMHRERIATARRVPGAFWHYLESLAPPKGRCVAL